MTKVLVFGTFDILHKGHLYFLKNAKKNGKFLTVVVARDATVRQIKGKEPLNNEEKRKVNLKKLDFVDDVVLGSLTDKYAVLDKAKPDVICLGYDQRYFTEILQQELKKRNLKTRIVRLKPYKAHIYKTSKLKNSSN
jgi:FAD synthetase